MRRLGLTVALLLCLPSVLRAQTFSHRGFVEGRGSWFPQEAVNDPVQIVGDLLAREELFFKPQPWVQFSGGLDFRANSHDQVEDEWRIDWQDRGILRPRVAVRRLTATLSGGGFTLDAGKQFIRWGRTDILNPTDRFAPRDYLNVIDNEFLPVRGVRASQRLGSQIVEAVWIPELTPSRTPLLDQRWTVVPPEAQDVTFVDQGSIFPEDHQFGVRWRHTGASTELSLSYFDGLNHLPNIIGSSVGESVVEVTRTYPDIRTYGGDVAVPSRLFTFKGEAAYFTSPSSTSEEYAGESVPKTNDSLPFAPDRGTAKSFIGRAAYTVNPNRTVAIEGAIRQTLAGVYVKGEYSEALGQYLRFTLVGVGIAGEDDDFLGQYHRNSHVSGTLRFSF
jgi:hypothetical protein